jgi:hypothetical protein
LVIPKGFHKNEMEAGSKYLDALGPFFERFFILGGPRVPAEKSSEFRLDALSKFGGTQNNIVY